MRVLDIQSKALPAKNLKRITTYVEPEVYELIANRADDENRTVSNMAATLLTQSVLGERRQKHEGKQEDQE